MDAPAHPRAGRPAQDQVTQRAGEQRAHLPFTDAVSGYGLLIPVRAGFRNDGRHGVARHYAAQQPVLLRTGHRPFSRDFRLAL